MRFSPFTLARALPLAAVLVAHASAATSAPAPTFAPDSVNPALLRGWPVGPTVNVLPPANGDYGDRHPMYRRGASLPETMLATREAYQAWRARQTAARALARFSPWSISTDLTADRLALISDQGPSASTDTGTWKPLPQLADDRILPWQPLGGDAGFAILYREIVAERATTITVGLGGGTHQAVALNGRVLLAANSSRIERYNVEATAQDDPVLDRLLVDLDLKPGVNRLAVAVTLADPRRRVFASTLEVHPVQRLWDWLWHDYAGDTQALLHEIDASWMGADVIAPTRLRNDRQQMWAREYRTTTPELQEGRPYTEFAFDYGNDKTVKPPPDSDRKPGLLHDGWFDARDLAFERAFLARNNAPAPASDDPATWLRACQTTAHRAAARRQLDSLAAAIDALARRDPAYPAADLRARLARVRAAIDTASELSPEIISKTDLEPLRRTALITENPLLRGQTLLFVKRHTYASHHIYDDYNHGICSFEGNLFAYSFDTGGERELLPQLRGGVFDRFDLSPDGQRVVFAYRRPREPGFRIHEAAVDGSWERQVTFPPVDDPDQIRRHSEYTQEELWASPTLHGHWTDDVNPVYLADGGIGFVSTRPRYSIYCGTHETTVTTLHRVERDGTKLTQLSNSPLSELFPSVMEDGRILYTRYEYVFKGNLQIHGLWSMLPDGRLNEEVYGNNIPVPPALAYGRQVPGRPDLVVFTGTAHETRTGSIQIVDRTKDRRDSSASASRNLTPEISAYGISNKQLRNGRWVYRDIYGPSYQDPCPLDHEFILVSGNPDKRLSDPRAYGIWLIDAFGNRILVYKDADISAFEPMLLRPRKLHPQAMNGITMADNYTPPLPKETADEPRATLILAEAGRGLPGVDPKSVKYLRILEQTPRTWDATNRRGSEIFPGSVTAVTLGGHIWVALHHGIVPVEEDGSASFVVPADKNIFVQALDENYKAIQTMRTFINLRPGEVRSCIGCHDSREAAPPNRSTPLALFRKPSVPVAEPGTPAAPRAIHYPGDIQPILNKSCISCHSGQGTAANLDLRDTPDWLFTKSYSELIMRALVPVIEEHQMAMTTETKHPILVPFAGTEHVPTYPPYKWGAHGSPLDKILDDRTHKNLLTPAERNLFTVWMDANAQFYGSYFGYHERKENQHPDWRPVPDLPMAKGFPTRTIHPAPGAP